MRTFCLGSVGVTPSPCGLVPQGVPRRGWRMGMEKLRSQHPKPEEPHTSLRSSLMAETHPRSPRDVSRWPRASHFPSVSL